MLPRPSSAFRRRATTTTSALALFGAAALFWSGRAQADAGERVYAWMLSPEISVPIGARLTALGATVCDASVHFCLDFPLLSFGFDVTRPSAPGAKSISLAFVQAPLTGLAALAPVFTKRSPVLKVAGLAVAWLSGGMFRWVPGGEGNMQTDGVFRSTLSFVLKNEVAVHPFVIPRYVRITPGAGLALTREGRSGDVKMYWTYTCGVGGFASFAAEHGGQSGWQPGVWFTCFFSGD